MSGKEFKAVAVLLAAGLSRRMGERNKLLIEIGGEPLVRRTAKAYIEAGVAVHAVLGFEEALIREALRGLPVTFVENPRYEDGQPASVRAGVESLAAGYDAVLIALSDQAALTPADIAALVDAFAASGSAHILIPYYKEQRGNPVVFPSSLLARMRAEGRNAACRAFIDRHPELTMRYYAPNDHFVIDIDTPIDLAAFEARQGANSAEEPEAATGRT
jgi:molybdenum cofactor cytidylyltransferase